MAERAKGRLRVLLSPDALLLLCFFGLSVPYVMGAVRQMTQEQVSLSREGPLRPPPRVGGTIVLHPLEGPAPGNPAEVLQRALAEARRRGYQVLPPVRSADVAAPAVVLQHDGGAILLVRRRGLLCLVHDPRLGEGVVRFDDVQRLHAGTYYPLRQPAQDQERGGGRR